jgi:type III restriction enzyme
LILETKGYDPLAHIKAQAAQRWVAAVNADGQYGGWHYAVAYKPEEVRQRLEETMTRVREEATAAAETT